MASRRLPHVLWVSFGSRCSSAVVEVFPIYLFFPTLCRPSFSFLFPFSSLHTLHLLLPGAILVTVHSFIHSFAWFHSKSTWRAIPSGFLIPHQTDQPTSPSVQSNPSLSFKLYALPSQTFTPIPLHHRYKNVVQHQQEPLLHRPAGRRSRIPGLPPRKEGALVQRPRPKRRRCRTLSLFSLVCFVETTSKMVAKRR